MSVDKTTTAAYIDKKNEIAQVVLSRKRKLIELYCISASAEPLPKLRLPLDENHNPALTLFLQQNDIEQGRYFQDATLPPRHSFPSKFTQQRQSPPLPSIFFAQANASESQRLHATPQPIIHLEATTSRDVDVSDNCKLAQGSQGLESSSGTLQAQPRPGSDGDVRRVPMQFSGVVVNGARPGSRQRSPRLILQADPFPGRHPLVTPSRPVSPPYSPGTEPQRPQSSHSADQNASAILNGPDNVLTPRRDNQEGLDHGRISTVHDAFGSVEVSSSVGSKNQFEQKQHVLHASDDHTHATDRIPASPSDTSPSVYTARTTAHSPMTSTEDDDSPQRPLPQVDPVTLQSSHLSQEDVAPSAAISSIGWPILNPVTPHGCSSELAKIPSVVNDLSNVNGQYVDDRLDETKVHIPDLPPSAVLSLNGALTAKSVSVLGSDDQFRAGISVKEQVISKPPTSARELASTLAMDVRGPDIAVPQSLSVASDQVLHSHSGKKDRVNKRRSQHGIRQAQFILSRPLQDRYKATMRDIRNVGMASNVTSQSYLKPLIQHQVACAENLKGLDHLLMGTSKTVATSDFIASMRDEQDLRILDRVRTLQSNFRWSLRQLKASEEPPQQESHWDKVLSSVKWLRTDFKEEAKLKTAVAKSLARWCAEWVSSSPSERTKLQIARRSWRGIFQGRKLHTEEPSTSQPISGDSGLNEGMSTNGIAYFAALPGAASISRANLEIDADLLNKIPTYLPGKKSAHTPHVLLRAKLEQTVSDELSIRLPDRKEDIEQFPSNEASDMEDEREPPLPPEDTSCALFHPESRALRARLTAPWVFKPPTAPMPPQSFFEHRSASQWSWEDDQLLKQYVKDFPSNWPLIADRMASKSVFNSYVERRTPWECYERLLAMEGPPTDAQARQYLRNFSYRLEKARESFDKHQIAVRGAAEQQAQNAGQPVTNLPQKRFPTPIRVDRKPNKRFLSLLDCARKLARKREQSAAKQQQSQAQQEGQAQKAAAAQIRTQPNQTPQYFSRMKHEAEVKEHERQQTMREQQRAMLEAQRRQPGGQQAHLTNGIGQQMRSRVASGAQPGTNVHTTVPNTNQALTRPIPPQGNQQMSLPNGASTSTQSASNGRPQANMQGQPRLAPHINGQSAPTPETMRMIAQLQQQRFQMSQQQQQTLQNQFGRVSPNVAVPNAATSANMLATFGNVNNSYPLSLQDSVALAQQVPNGAAPRASPHVALPATNFQQTPSQPQQLSSGHVTAFANLEHQIRSQNPNLSPQEARHLATLQLKQMTTLSRQNAINAATGAHPSQHPLMRGAAQSPLPLVPPQQSVGTPQQQLPQTQQHSPYQANGMLAAAANLSASSIRHSPVNISATLAGSPQFQAQQPQPQQSQYSAQLRQQMFAQQQRQHQLGLAATGMGMGVGAGVNHQSASPPTAHLSPAMGMALPAAFAGMNRTPSAQSLGSGILPGGSTQGQATAQGMRPPSRSASAIGLVDGNGAGAAVYAQQQGQRPLPSPSPRPVTAQGFSGQ